MSSLGKEQIESRHKVSGADEAIFFRYFKHWCSYQITKNIKNLINKASAQSMTSKERQRIAPKHLSQDNKAGHAAIFPTVNVYLW